MSHIFDRQKLCFFPWGTAAAERTERTASLPALGSPSSPASWTWRGSTSGLERRKF